MNAKNNSAEKYDNFLNPNIQFQLVELDKNNFCENILQKNDREERTSAGRSKLEGPALEGPRGYHLKGRTLRS